MANWFKRQIKKILVWIINSFTSCRFFHKPRLWTNKEWSKKTPKEKLWIWYKHHDALIGLGNGELDKVLPFLTGEFLTTTAAVSVFIKMFELPSWTYFLYPAFYIGYKYLQWWIGNEIDKRDFPALTSEISKKREIFSRKVLELLKSEEWRKKL